MTSMDKCIRFIFIITNNLHISKLSASNFNANVEKFSFHTHNLESKVKELRTYGVIEAYTFENVRILVRGKENAMTGGTSFKKL